LIFNRYTILEVNHNRFLGYTKAENKQLVIVPRQAKIVKRIYSEYLMNSCRI